MVKAVIIGLNEWGKWGLWEIGQYFDCANLERYLDLLHHLKGQRE